jgi:membrane fusion protein (multidrug efflux system)
MEGIFIRNQVNSRVRPAPFLFLALLGVSTLLLPLTGCRKSSQANPGGPQPERVVQVVTALAVRQPVAETLSLIGSLTATEMVEIKPQTEGIVKKIHFNEGQPVQENDLLIELDDTKLAASLAESEANFQLSKANYDRNQQLFREKLVSQQEFDQVAATFQARQAGLDLKRRQLQDTRIIAPFSGIIGSREISPGQVISMNTTLTWLVDLDPVNVEINVPERFLGQLKTGQGIDIKVAAFPGQSFQGKVFFIAPFVDPQLRTALIKARIPNPDQRLIPGMFANLDLTLRIRDDSVVIPEQAVTKLLDDGMAMLFVRDENDQAQLKQVKVGMRLSGKMEILDGLDGGEFVIIEGMQKLAPGVKVRTRPTSEPGGDMPDPL